MSGAVKNTNKAFDHIDHTTEIRNHDNDPAVVKKVEKARETILRVGFPQEIKKK